MKAKLNYKTYLTALTSVLLITLSGCEKYLDDTPLPAKQVAGSEIYTSDNTVSTVLSGALLNLSNSGPFTGSASGNIGYTLGLYTDELVSLLNGNFADTFYKDAIQSGQSGNWTNLYGKIFVVNSAIEGINASTATLTYKNQWLGEAYFLRAFYYYYLVNIYGDVPLALTTDYKINNALSRSPQADVYKQIIADLKTAQGLLSDDYRNGYGATTAQRIRPNKGAATALLARVYLYTQDWADAEAAATSVISNSNYALVSVDKVFTANSQETIWALAPSAASPAYEYKFYNNGIPANIPSGQTPANFFDYAYMSNFLLKQFEPNDARAQTWIRAATTSTNVTYYFPNKYSSPTNNAQYEVLFRLAEQYLIRAEAKAHLNELSAFGDLNTVRARAGLGGTNAANLDQFLAAVAKERQTELFTECGHRFFDLKRTAKIDSVMNVVAPTKPTTWSSYMSYWPIPPADLLQDPNLTPNPGYLQ